MVITKTDKKAQTRVLIMVPSGKGVVAELGSWRTVGTARRREGAV